MFDPIELWNSPTSQTRKEKEFFDSTFRPFYRPCQIIVKAKNVPLEIPYTDNKTGEEYVFGPDGEVKALRLANGSEATPEDISADASAWATSVARDQRA